MVTHHQQKGENGVITTPLSIYPIAFSSPPKLEKKYHLSKNNLPENPGLSMRFVPISFHNDDSDNDDEMNGINFRGSLTSDHSRDQIHQCNKDETISSLPTFTHDTKCSKILPDAPIFTTDESFLFQRLSIPDSSLPSRHLAESDPQRISNSSQYFQGNNHYNNKITTNNYRIPRINLKPRHSPSPSSSSTNNPIHCNFRPIARYPSQGGGLNPPRNHQQNMQESQENVSSDTQS